MNIRKLLDGTEVPLLDQPVKLEIYTKSPEKWLLIDLETGERYTGHNDPNAGPSHWKKVKTCRTLT